MLIELSVCDVSPGLELNHPRILSPRNVRITRSEDRLDLCVPTVTVSIFPLRFLFFFFLPLSAGPDIMIFIFLNVYSTDMNPSYSHISSFKKIIEC